MQVSLENVGKLERKLTVRFPADQYESRVRERIGEMSRNVRLKGFRPGKVPVKVIEQRFGAQIRGEALSDLVGSTFRDAVQQEKLQPVAQPSIDTSGKPENGEIAYTATFEVFPELPQVDVAALKIERTVAKVKDADIDRMIETLRQQRRSFEAVERAATDGDLVTFDFAATSGGVRYPENGRERMATVLGAGMLFAAFDNALRGHQAGDTFEADIAFPGEFRVAQLAGREAHMEIHVEKVQEPRVPELDAAFIKGFGIGDGDLEHFRREVRANLERELAGALRARLRNEVGQKLADAHADIDVPQALVRADAQALVRASVPNLPAEAQLPPAALEAAAPMARRRVIAGLLLRQIAQSHNIRVDNQRVSEQVAAIASTYEEPEQVIELYRNDPQLLDGVRTSVLEDQVAEWVAGHADATERTLGFDEVMHPQPGA